VATKISYLYDLKNVSNKKKVKTNCARQTEQDMEREKTRQTTEPFAVIAASAPEIFTTAFEWKSKSNHIRSLPVE
jgi:hypothetical protein